MMILNPWEVKQVGPGAFTYYGQTCIKCSFCGEQWTLMLGTKLCDRCLELKRRVQADPHLARRALAELESQE